MQDDSYENLFGYLESCFSAFISLFYHELRLLQEYHFQKHALNPSFHLLCLLNFVQPSYIQFLFQFLSYSVLASSLLSNRMGLFPLFPSALILQNIVLLDFSILTIHFKRVNFAYYIAITRSFR